MVDRGLATVMLIAGIAFGFFAGRVYQLAMRGYKDWQTAKKAVPNLRSTFFGFLGNAIVITVIGVLVIGLMGIWTTKGGGGQAGMGGGTGTPRPTPHPSSASPHPRGR